MEELGASRRAQSALVKFLIKHNLIRNETSLKPYSDSDYFPISFYAREGCFDEASALQVISTKLNVPIFTLSKQSSALYLKLLDHDWAQKIDLNLWKSIRAIPVEINLDHMRIAMANPLDHETKHALEFKIGTKIEIGIASESEIVSLLASKAEQGSEFSLESLIETSPNETEDNENQQQVLSRYETSTLQVDLEAAPVIKLVNKIISDSARLSASDIHITPEKDALMIRVRIDGIMRPLFNVPSNLSAPVISRLKLLCGMDISERRKPQDGRLRIKTGSGIKDLRVSSLPTIHGENIVARILSTELTRTSFEQLGMDHDLAANFRDALQGSSRVVLVTGPTGSGKTSTLYASMLSLNDGTQNIVTVEDPIEYRVDGIRQIQVNPKVQLTFAEGLRSILRQDPDIIMVGEVRDQETAEMAMQAAQTGHLVLSTLHTDSAAAAITRLRDLGIPTYLIASSLSCVLAQRLVRTLCEHCKRPAASENSGLIDSLGLDPRKTFEPQGCEWCDQSGYLGRVAIYSLLNISREIQEAIRTECPEQQIEKMDNRFRSLQSAGLELITQGLTSIEEIERVVGTLSSSEKPSPNVIEPQRTESGPTFISEQKASSYRGKTLSKPKLLLVEDDENTRTILAMLFRKELFDVIEASDGLDALNKVYAEVPDVIVSDLMMPKMTGKEMLQKLRKDSRLKNIPVLILTAAAGEENELALIESGADDFVNKTSSPKIMVKRIERLLSR